MKKILLVTRTSTDTISSCAYNLYKAIKKDGKYDVYVYSIDQRTAYSYPFENVYPCPSQTKGIRGKIAIVRDLCRVKKELSIDYSISTLTAFTAYNLLSSCSEKKFAIYHAPAKQAKLQGWFTYILCVLTIFFSNIFCEQLWAVSEEALDDINRFSIIKKKNQKVYNIHYYNKIIEQSNEKVDLQKYGNYILYTGSIYELKGFDRLVRSFSQVSHTLDSLNLLVCGSFRSKEYENKIGDLINYYGLQNRIYFLGYQDNPYKYMAQALALVSPSYSESLPGVIIEALSIGVPVVSTNSSKGVWEIFNILEKYSSNIASNIVSDDGYITPNSVKGTELERKVLNSDEMSLAVAIVTIVNNPIKPNFSFKKQCSESYILQKIYKAL